MGKLSGKIALVTGGGSGIGAASAKALLEEGARVAIAGRDQKKLDAVAAQLGNPMDLMPIAADISDPRQVGMLVAAVTKKLGGRIDILVNNAGTNIKERTFRELTVEAWDRLIDVNLNGAFYCIQAIAPDMIAHKDGVIINIVSIAGKRASPLGGIGYAAAKFGQAALGIALAAEEKDSGIRVCNIYPGEVDTPILVFRPQPLSAEQRAKILRPEDVAEAVRFVALLPPHVSVPELVIKPTSQMYV
ncbi:MAG: SDR family oxidoreductase [Planctomycetes bacterium]|nr:SDR family oxidoreductase [Planctomycetota bacterium]